MIIGITGTLGAGKGTVVGFLKERGFVHFSVRDFLIEEIKKRGLDVNRDNMVLVANDLRQKNGAAYIVEELYRRAIRKGCDAVIESVRCVGEVEALRGKDGFVLWAVDADIESRYARIVERGGCTDKVSFQEFVLQEEREMMNKDINKQNLKGCIEMANVRIRNDWTVEELKGKVFRELDKIKGKIGFGTGKRKDVISWDDYFMSIAVLSSYRSKDPNTQVGACIVDSNKKIVGVGYNGFPIGCSDDDLPWNAKGDFLDVKYSYVCHAELNAILNSVGRDLFGCSIFVYLFPCNECAKAIIQSGIKEVVYLSDKYAELDMTKASKKMFKMSGVKTRKFSPKMKSVVISLNE